MGAHLHHGGKIEIDQRLALLGRQLEPVGEGGSVGKILRAQPGIVASPCSAEVSSTSSGLMAG